MDAPDRALLEETVGDAVGDAAAGGGASVDKVLAELGWLEMLDAEPRDAVDVVFTALGTTGASASVLDDVVVAALGMEPRPDLAVMLPPFATWDAPGRLAGADARGHGLATARVASAAEILVVGGDGTDASAVAAPTAAADVVAVGGIDPEGGFHSVRIDHAGGDAIRLHAGAWDAAVAAGRRALAHQILGASRTMLDLARTHAIDRTQFGRPIAQFQAVRHRLADALVAIEALDAALGAAWDEPGSVTAALAKVTAGRSTRTVGTHAQQVLAGIGFTTDHPFHRFLKRTMALEGLLGSADEIVVDLGRLLLRTRRVPTLIEL